MSDISDTQPKPTQPTTAQRPPRRWSSLLAVLGFLVLIVLGIVGGYFNGRMLRLDAQATQVSQQLLEQFNLGNQAMDAGQYAVALQHFQGVINQDPNFPGVQAAYTQLLLRMKMSPTPTFTPSPTSSPTPDLRTADQIYSNLQSLLASTPQSFQDWDNVVSTLNSLRKVAPTYRTVELDGIYYMALRQRGLSQIFAQPCQNINLEGGIYDLTLAERFGQLDGYAETLRTYARLYISGASFWEIDWTQAQYYFNQVYMALPDLMDSSCLAAKNRWRIATINVADQLAASGDFCGADDQYAAALNVDSPDNATTVPTATFVDNKCHPPAPPAPAATETPTPGGPTDTPTPTNP